ncbi:DUF1460 domain-containing protein [Prevotella sp. E15-22]|uniref:N-acetylmuramoyl-L-alanine amidase-like domain-containing protein n=1 Tax=Prevotella sp. E15-22 TaxID=2937774 RepID=UPI00206ECCD7|nr:N-acetylmuramoyl-L-alanine amidase-like domain-containing protein [Prevotella sp. E15-22]UPS45760.1 DUF1460 domain-containing protein [Prevotella sp. E15-22]
MKRLLILCFMSFSVLVSRAHNADSLFVVKTLQGTSTDVLSFARQFIGLPYVAHTLEIHAKGQERLVVNTRELDCTTFVENVIALTLCAKNNERHFNAFRKYLRQLRYRHGVINGYPSRLHYFTDWIEDNTKMGFVHEIQQEKSPFSAVQIINVGYMSNHPQSYEALKVHPEFIDKIAAQEKDLNGRRYRYIPKNMVKNTKLMRKIVHDGDVIAITCSKSGLDIAHLGFAVWRRDGLHLLNASQLYHRVVEEPMTLDRYLKKHPKHTGIRIIRLNN